jgi:hydantoinase/carbamoylase family amidase
MRGKADRTGSSAPAAVDPERTLAELRELTALTSNSRGVQRVAWTSTWRAARDWLCDRLAELPVTVETDPAGNLWATLPGRSPAALALGSHLDSVPDGGWLDGALGVLAGLEVLRRFAAEDSPPITVKLVDWADEEGARFGRSLVGSSAATGTLDPADLSLLQDGDGAAFDGVLRDHGVEPERMPDAGAWLADVAAYLELHIEQGPVLDERDQSLGVVEAVVGIRRHAVTVTGQPAHAGPTPMRLRRDPVLTAARIALAVAEHARALGGVGTVGTVRSHPGIPTAIARSVELTIDVRHHDEARLGRLSAEVLAAARAHAAVDRTDLAVRDLFTIDPVAFHPALVPMAETAVLEVAGEAPRLRSGALHDAAEVARAGIPAVMLFTRSLGGVSHTADEDTLEGDIMLGVRALDRLAARVTEWLASS